ncbi:MAG: site-specific integrase, partial [Sphingobacteriaceae bacterium]
MAFYSVKLTSNKDRIHQDGQVSLYLQVIINRKRKLLPLELNWPADYVDNKTGTLLPKSKKDENHSDYQIIINTAISKVNEIFKLYRIGERVLNIELFLKEYTNFESRKDFLPFMEEEISRRYNEKNISHGTFKNHLSVLRKLQDFKPAIMYYEISSELLANFSRFLNVKKKNNPNTVWAAIKALKTYLRIARLKGININQEYLNHKSGMVSNRLIYLEDEELRRLFIYFKVEDISDVERQSLRSFLFQAFTGLRISDVYRANWAWLNNNNELHFLPHKTERFKKSVTVPLSQLAMDLIQTKRGLFFNLPAEPVINRNLKIIADRCNIRKSLSTHVGRHTFGTLFYRHTKDLLTLSKIMGHSKIQDTMIYAHINDLDKRIGVN